MFAKVVHDKGAAFPNVIWFIDGTMQAVSRPSYSEEDQKALYNGWKHLHALKFQSIVTPDGITSSIIGPYAGSRHDQSVYFSSRTEQRIKRYLNIPSGYGYPYVLYGDPGYMSSKCLFSLLGGVRLTEDDKLINRSMSKVRISVEWEFSEVEKYFKYCKYKYAMKTGENEPGVIYILSTVFKNMLHCVHRGGSSTNAYFGLEPPTVEEYISGLRRDKIDGEDEDYII